MELQQASTRDRIASASVTAGVTVLLLMLGASLYEHLVIDTVWADNPALIQPERGGLDRKVVWIPLHAAVSLVLPVALWANWRRRPVRRAVLGAVAIYLAMRLWTIVYFIPAGLRFEQAYATSEGAGTWIALSTLRFPMLVASLVLLTVASRRLRRGLAGATVSP
jgi:hypothetical protein